MADEREFPTFPQSQLPRDEIADYLIEQRRRGYYVFQHPKYPHALILALDDLHRINFIMGEPSGCQIQLEQYGNHLKIADVSNMTELRAAVDSMARDAIGERWRNSVDRTRLNENQPATNFASIASLIGGSAIEAVFDPYLENKSLASLLDILSFGAGSVANGIRVLSTSKTSVGQVPRLTKVGFDAWLIQLGIKGEIRLMPVSEHRRFLLLSGGQSLLLGQSLNAIHKNEAVRLEPDTEDRAFFNTVWKNATPLQ